MYYLQTFMDRTPDTGTRFFPCNKGSWNDCVVTGNKVASLYDTNWIVTGSSSAISVLFSKDLGNTMEPYNSKCQHI